MTILIFSLLALALYLAAALLVGRSLWQRQPLKTPAAYLLTLAASFGHLLALLPALLTPQGMNLSFFNAASLIALFVVVLVLSCCRRLSLSVLLLPVQLITAAIVAFAAFLPQGQSAPINEAPGILAHIVFSVLAYGVISIAMLQSGLLLIQEQQLRKRPISVWIRSFPPLQTMESLLFSFLTAGWSLLSLSLITGWLFLDNLFAQHLVHKTVLSSFAWLVFTLLLWGRYRLGWRGNKAVRLTMAGFFLLMLAYFGSKLAREFIFVT